MTIIDSYYHWIFFNRVFSRKNFSVNVFLSYSTSILFTYWPCIDVCCFQPDNLLASVLAHPILTASGLQGRDHRFIPPSTAASAAASVLASLSSSQLAHPGRSRAHSLLPTSVHPESTMYRSDRTIIDRYLTHVT